ncbi:MAG: hypothetical protein KC502_05370 [Myxococcales bacterium]|nr:hypothetical protein [Myxococcales bacterium]
MAQDTLDGDGLSDARASDVGPTFTCGTWGKPKKAGKLPSPIDEASGLVVSSFDPDVVWTHNDGKDDRLFAVRASTGKILAEMTLKGLTDKARDWEDLAAGPCGKAQPNKRCLYVADVGDNGQSRSAVHIHRLVEPDPTKAPKTTTDYETMTATYPTKVVNCEGAVVDESGRVWLFSKSKTTLRVFAAPFASGKQEWTLIAALNPKKTMGDKLSKVTGADWRPSTKTLLLRTYETAWELCLGSGGLDDIANAVWQEVEVHDEPQGEAIAYGPDRIWQVSEGGWPRLRYLLHP